MNKTMGIFVMTALALLLQAPAMADGEEESAPLFVEADTLVSRIDEYAGRRIETSGTVIHVCGVDGKKMRLKTAGDVKIKIVPGEGMEPFTKEAWQNKTIRVRGIVHETRLDGEYAAKLEKDRSVLCSIDYTPCISKNWTDKLRSEGKADSISAVGTGKLRERMGKTGKGYLSMITIVADHCEVVGDAEK